MCSVSRRTPSSSGSWRILFTTRPLNVSEEIVEFSDSDMFDNDDLIAYPNSPTRPKWEENSIHAARELDGNPSDSRRTRS